jgi:hypothetical protein
MQMTNNFKRPLLKVNNILVILIEVARRRRRLHIQLTVRYLRTELYFTLLTVYIVAQEEEDEPGPVAPSGNPEHIVGTGGDTEKLDPRMLVYSTYFGDQRLTSIQDTA